MRNLLLLAFLLPILATAQVTGVTRSKYSSDSTTTRGLINTNTTAISNEVTNRTNAVALKMDKADSSKYLNVKDTITFDPSSYATTTSVALKQNLITLTTTGASGSATFNQGTGALNIPNYTGGGGTSIIGADSVYVSTSDKRLHYRIGGYDYRLAILDSSAITTVLNLDWSAYYINAGGGIWTVNANNAIAPNNFAANLSGIYYATNTGSADDGTGIGLDAVNSVTAFSGFDFGILVDGSGVYYTAQNNVFVSTTISRLAGDQYGIRRNGSTGVVTAEYRRSGGSWQVMGTYSGTSTAQLYIKASLTGQLSNPKIEY